jgi:hypothetical protein
MTRGQHLGPLLLAALAFAAVACDKSDASTAAPSAEPTPPAVAPIASAAEPPSSEPEATASAAPEATASAAPAGSVPSKPAALTAKTAAAEKTPAIETTPSAAPAKSAAPERKVKTVGGTSASSDSFSLSISAPSPVRAGQSANAAIVLAARAPYHCNPKYPYKFAVDGGSTIKGMSVSEKSASMAVPFTPSQKGRTTVSGTLSFSVCTADKCLIEKRKLSVSVDAD